MGKGSGYGKVILFGEHFVIYDTPGIISALDRKTDATVARIPGVELVIEDHRSGAKGYTESKKAQQAESLQRMFRHLGISQSGLRIRLDGNLPAFSGIGASGASCVAIARALSEEFNLQLTDEQVNAAAHEAERAYHGETTAGLDNVASTYGGLICFRQGNPPRIERLKIRQPIEIVLADSGIVANTKELIEGVAQRRQCDPGKYENLIRRADSLVQQAKTALLEFRLEEVGMLMDQNHLLLQSIEVSCHELDHLCEISRDAGAWGAKQTGGGGGGCMVALTPGEQCRDKVAAAIEKEGFSVLRTRVGI